MLLAAKNFCEWGKISEVILEKGITLFENQLKLQNLNNTTVYSIANPIKHWLKFRNNPQNSQDKYLIDLFNWLHEEEKAKFYNFINFTRTFSDIKRGLERKCIRKKISGNITDATAHIMQFLPKN